MSAPQATLESAKNPLIKICAYKNEIILQNEMLEKSLILSAWITLHDFINTLCNIF